MTRRKEEVPKVDSRILCRHPVLENKRAWVSPSKIENLYKVYWKDGKVDIQWPLSELTVLSNINKEV